MICDTELILRLENREVGLTHDQFHSTYLWKRMTVRRNDKNEVVVTLPGNVDAAEIQRMLDYLQYLELTAGSKATQGQAEALAAEANANMRKTRLKKTAS